MWFTVCHNKIAELNILAIELWANNFLVLLFFSLDYFAQEIVSIILRNH